MNETFSSSRSYPDGVRFVFAEGPFRVQPADFGRDSDAGPLRTFCDNTLAKNPPRALWALPPGARWTVNAGICGCLSARQVSRVD